MSSVYEIVTNKIIESLEKGVIPWKKPWTTGFPKNYVSGKAYTGINTLLLRLKEFSCPYWLTWNQIQSLNGSVKKGEQSSIVVFFKPLEIKYFENHKDGQKEEKKLIPFLRYYLVWNWE